MQYSLVGTDDGSNLTVFVPGQKALTAHSTHPNFEAILKGVLADDLSVVGLFDVTVQAATKFERLSERVTAAHGRLYLDGAEVDNSLAKQVVRFIQEGVKDWKPLVNFFENVQANSNEHSREQLYTWLNSRDFTITDDGLIVGYKGVQRNADGTPESITRGPAIVDGVAVNGHVPNKPGSVVEMARPDVAHDPGVACSVGLHVGTWDYAHGFAQGLVLELHVNPRDVVSVPTDCDGQKMRVCRYTVVKEIDAPYSNSVQFGNDYDDEDDDYGYDPFEVDEGDDPWEPSYDDDEDGLDCGCEDWDGGECKYPDCKEGREDDEAVEKLRQERHALDTMTGTARSTVSLPLPTNAQDDGSSQVRVGDAYETTDKRRKGTTFTVESVDTTHARGKTSTGVTRSVKLSRLLSGKYRKV